MLFLLIIMFYGCTESNLAFHPRLNPSNGTLELVQTFGGSKNDVAKSVVSTADGGFAVLGYTQSLDGDITDKATEDYDFWMLKFNSEVQLEWNKTYGGSGDDRGSSLIETSDGGYALLGYSDSSDGDVSFNNGNRDFWLVKINASGVLSWEKSFGYEGVDEGVSIIETSDNHLMLSGVLDVTASGGEGNQGRFSTKHAGGDYWSIKITPTGDIVWSRFYGGSFTDSPTGISETLIGGFINVGGSDSNDVDISNNKGSYDFWIVKSDVNGDIVWEKSFGGSEIDEARDVISDGGGNHIIVGDTRSNDQDVAFNNGAADLWAIKVS
ncbi:MAG: hypothetical protein KC454_11910, partial [Flavobacteriales bacterium]|nr:hypothetical protein [Flavobacteriales bacterium]